MKSLLVIGGSGFFGKSILDAFNRGLLLPWKINQIIVIARNSTRLIDTNHDLITENIKLIDLDIATAKELPFADYVIHAAASTDARNYQHSSETETQNILKGINNYCQLASKFHQESKIIFTSSGAVYGQQPATILHVEENHVAKNFDGMNLDKLLYAQAKLEAEHAIKKLASNGMSVSIARCFSFIGKYLPREQHFAIGNFLEDGINGRPILVKATSHVYRSYMYADDLVEWLIAIAEAANPSCPIFNVGSDQETSIIHLAKEVSTQLKVPLISADITNSNLDRYVPSIEKAKKILNLKLNYGLPQAINKTIQLI